LSRLAGRPSELAPDPDGVWMVEMTAVAESRTLVYSTYLDATNGFHLCTAEQK